MSGASQGAAVVTGAGGGLGALLAHRVAAAGQAVACVDIDAERAAETATDIRDRGYDAQAFGVDVTDDGAVSDLQINVVASLGRVRSLLNIAGVLHRGSVESTDPASWRRTVEVNVTGPYLLLRAFADDLRAGPDGRVVNCSSFSAPLGYPFAAYAASKAALSSLTRSALFDFWGSGVTVNAVCPGAMDTPMLDRSMIPQMIAKTPSGSIATGDDVAAAVLFLNSAEARNINGVNLTVDGGASAVFSYAV